VSFIINFQVNQYNKYILLPFDIKYQELIKVLNFSVDEGNGSMPLIGRT